MKKIVRGGLFLTFVYFMAIVSTLLITDRVAELDAKDLRNNNSSLSINVAR